VIKAQDLRLLFLADRQCIISLVGNISTGHATGDNRSMNGALSRRRYAAIGESARNDRAGRLSEQKVSNAAHNYGIA
jgi:hypothetical protein